MDGTADVNRTADTNGTVIFPNGRYGQLNHSYFFFNDTKKGWGWTDIFSIWNEFNRSDEQVKYLEATIVSILAVVSLITNLLFIMLYAAKKELRLVTNFFVLNVCIVSLIFIPVAITIGGSRLHPEWSYGDAGCKTVLAVFIITASVKVWIMALLSIERLIKIVYRNRPSITLKQSIIMAVFVAWILPTICYMPMIILTIQQATVPFGSESRQICTLLTKRSDEVSTAMVLFGVAFSLHYLIPIMILVGCYTSILVKLKQNFTRINARRLETFHSKAQISHHRTRKTVLLLFTMMVATIIMWIPLFVLLGVVIVDTANQTYKVRSQYFIWVLVSMLVNTIINPLLYAFTTDKFHDAMREFWVGVRSKTLNSLIEKFGSGPSNKKSTTVSESVERSAEKLQRS